MVLKCAAFSCRSGYRPTKQEDKMTARGETPPCKKHVFTFPKKAEIRIQWIAAVHRADSGFNPDNSGVCELHFRPQDFALGIAVRTKTERQRLRLNTDAIPSVFNNYPGIARPKVVEESKSSQASSAHHAHEQQGVQDQTDEFLEQDEFTDLEDLLNKLPNEMLPSGFGCEEQGNTMLEGEMVVPINNMWDELSKERLPSGYTMVKMSLPENGQDVITIRMEEMDDVLGLPVIRRNLTIYPNLHYRMHVGGTEVSVHKASTLTAEFGTLGSAAEVLDVLACLKTATVDSRDLMVCAAEMLERVSDEGGRDSFFECRFAAELLKLKTGSADPGAALKNGKHRTQSPSRVDQGKAKELWDDVQKKLPLEFIDVAVKEEIAGLCDHGLVDQGKAKELWNDVQKKLPLEFVEVAVKEEIAGLCDDDLTVRVEEEDSPLPVKEEPMEDQADPRSSQNEGVREERWMEEVYVKEEPLEHEAAPRPSENGGGRKEGWMEEVYVKEEPLEEETAR